MPPYKAEFIKVLIGAAGFQTMPVEPENRLPDSEIRIEVCTEEDADRVAEGLYVAFPETWWAKMEPVADRPPEQITRQNRLAKRLRPSFKNHPNLYWIKAVLASTGEIVGIAGWAGPGHPIHNVFRRSATEYFGWKEKMGWSDEEIEEMWKGVNIEAWNEQIDKNDDIRQECLGDEPHWFLAPLMTWPEYQGRGIGKKLLDWAIEQADATEPVTPLYLESAPTARAVYMHSGFVPQGEHNFIRRGPATVRGLEAEESKEEPTEKLSTNVVEKEVRPAAIV